MWSTTPLFIVLVALGAIEAAPKLNNFGAGFNPYTMGAVILRRPVRNFGVLQLGGGYGMAKRVAPSSTNKEKQRRGPLNGLIPGGGFGRAARSNECRRANCVSPTYAKVMKLLKEEKFHPYFSSEKRNDSGVKDGQEKSIDAYQYREFLGSK